MKKNLIKVLICIVICIICILSYFIVKNNKISYDEKKFRLEYESFNGKKGLLSKKKYVNVKIPERNNVVYSSLNDVIKIMSDGTGIIYFGYPECQSCRSSINVLIKKAIKENKKINYCNLYFARDEKSIDKEGKTITLQEGTKEYYKIIDILGDKAQNYVGIDDENTKRLYFPTVIFVKNGKIVDSVISDGELEDNNKKMKNQQIRELNSIYKIGFKKIK